MSQPLPPFRDYRRLPDPSVCENGMRPCNVPYVIDGETVGHCERDVWPENMLSRWLPWRRLGHVGKPHTITWWTR